MAQQTIGIGTSANDGTGDTIRDAFDKANDNFTELYTGLTGLLDFKGSTDCSANPNYPAASKGDFYLVSVAGKIGGASGIAVEVGDSYFSTADNAGGTQASVGSSWTVIQGNITSYLPLTGGTLTGDLIVPAEAYSGSWNGSNEVPTKNDVYDKIEAVIAGAGTISALDDVPDVNAPSPSDGDVLTWDNGAGEWSAAAPAGGTGSGHTFTMPYGVTFASADAGAFATLGNVFIPIETMTVAALYGVWNNDTIGNIYSMFIATVDSSANITGTVATAASRFTTTATGFQMKKFSLSAPVNLTAGTRYYLAIVRTNGTGTTGCKATFHSGSTLNTYQNLPIDLTYSGICRAWHAQNSDSPSSSTASGSSTSTIYGVGMNATF